MSAYDRIRCAGILGSGARRIGYGGVSSKTVFATVFGVMCRHCGSRLALRERTQELDPTRRHRTTRCVAQARASRVDARSGTRVGVRAEPSSHADVGASRARCVSSVRVTKAQRYRYSSHTDSDARDTFQGDIWSGWRGSSDATLASSRTLWCCMAALHRHRRR